MLNGCALVQEMEDHGYRQPGDDVPDAPPGRDHQDAAVGREAGEKGGAQEKHQPEARVLYAGFDRQRPAVAERDLEDRSHGEADTQCKQVVDKYDDEDVLDAFQECVDVSREGQDHHRNEEEDRDPLEGLPQAFRNGGQETGAEDAQGKRDTEQDEDGLEDVPQGDDEGRRRPVPYGGRDCPRGRSWPGSSQRRGRC